MVASKKRCLVQPNRKDHDHSLLSFMNLASTKVKIALEKPNSFKRNVNHRRFLQKQFKTLVRSPDKVPKRKSFHPIKENIQPMDYTSGDKQLPPSPATIASLLFEPIRQPYLPPLDMQQSISGPCLNSSLNNSCDVRQNEHSRLPETTHHYLPIPDLVVEEDGFLTGEELTQAIELKDLFIPEVDLTRCLSIHDSLGLSSEVEPQRDFDSWICEEFLKDDIAVF